MVPVSCHCQLVPGFGRQIPFCDTGGVGGAAGVGAGGGTGFVGGGAVVDGITGRTTAEVEGPLLSRGHQW